ncbi:MAG: outer membrane beta-barrel protein [Saprospiraceae bacterium]|nr:outer membrane beta-barrel protein [Saprospiraceae bacterium]
MRKFTLLCCCLFLILPHILPAQTPSRVTLSGTVSDTSGAEIALPTVMLLNPQDSTLINYTRGNEKGEFVFKNIPNKSYLLKVSYIGYIPLQVAIEPAASPENNLGVLGMKPLNEQLMEVVVRTAKAALSIRGDTVEYDPSSFKVPPGSSVEDLLRRLPGIEVDADGNIRAQGQDIRRVYVDGKTFFGDDPKAATKNLGAETLSKVQVYDEASEQTKITGIDDGKEIKVMNLELKDEYKKGSFGKVTGAVGTEERLAGRASYNRFNEKEQLSFIGYGNNINETGVNWEDYGEFKGQSTFSDFDNGDFGFEGGGRGYYFSSGDGPLNNFDGRGFTENFGGGVNYNFDNKKTKVNASYFYNQTDLTFREYTTRSNFVEEGTFTNEDTLRQNALQRRHSLSSRLEHEIDSSNNIIVKANLALRENDSEQAKSQYFTDNLDMPINRLLSATENLTDAGDLTSAAIFRHRFRKKGRTFAASAGFNTTRNDGTDNLLFQNLFIRTEDPSEFFRQDADVANRTQQLKSSLLFSEPLSKKWFIESFYNFSQTDNLADRQVEDPTQNGGERIDSLSIYYDNQVLYNRLGSVVRYAHDGLNIGLGLAGQQLQLKGDYARGEGEPALGDPVRLEFFNWIPYASMEYEFTNNMSVDFNYRYSVNEPSFTDLQPVAIITNPLFVRQGNPALEPERMHSLNLGYNYWNPASFANIGVYGGFNVYDEQIVYNQTVELIDSVGLRTTTTPANATGGYGYDFWFWSNFPIIKTKLSVGLNGGFNGRLAPAFVNEVKNETRSNGVDGRFSLNYTPSNKLILNGGFSLGFDDVRYSIQSQQNQQLINNSAYAGVKWEFVPKTFLESNFNYNANRNNQTGFEQNVPIWNASVRRIFGPKNRWETRLAAFDLLDRRVNVVQRATQNYVTTSVAETLAQYFMLSLSYNVRGFETGVKKRGFW